MNAIHISDSPIKGSTEAKLETNLREESMNRERSSPINCLNTYFNPKKEEYSSPLIMKEVSFILETYVLGCSQDNFELDISQKEQIMVRFIRQQSVISAG